MLPILIACVPAVPVDREPTCPTGQVPEGGGCVPERCGEGPWGGIVADVYVLAGAEAGDGTAEHPYGTIAEGAGGGTIAVGAGSYAETPRLRSDSTLLGRCPELVTIDQASGGLVAEDVDLVARGFTLRRAPGAAVAAIGRSVVDVDDVVVIEAGGAGFYVEGSGATLTATASRIEAGAEAEAWGAVAVEGGHLVLAAVDVEAGAGAGVYTADAGSRVDLVGVRVSGGLGGGASVGSGATLVAAGTTFAGNTGVGVDVSGTGSTATLVESAVLGGRPDAGGWGGTGVAVQDGATATLTSTRLQGNAEAGLSVTGVGSVARGADVSVGDTRASPTGGRGFGVVVGDGAVLEVEGLDVADSVGVGVFVQGATVSGDDLTVRRTRSNAFGAFGRGVVAEAGAELSLGSLHVADSREVGVFLAGEGTRAELGVGVEDARASAAGAGGYGILLLDGAVLRAPYLGVRGAVAGGVYAAGAGTLLETTALDLTGVARSAAHPLAVGVQVQDGATARLTGWGQVEGVEGPGLAVRTGGRVEVEGDVFFDGTFAGVVVEDATLEGSGFDVAAGEDPQAGGGIGILVVATAPGTTRLVIEDTGVGGAPLAGVWAEGPAAVTIAGGDVRGGDGVDLGGGIVGMGNGIFARGAAALRVDGVRVRGADVAVLLDGATASGAGNTFVDGIFDLVQQGCEGVAPPTLDADPARTASCPDPELLVVPLGYTLGDAEIHAL